MSRGNSRSGLYEEIAIGVLHLLGGNVTTTILSALSGILIARLLGPEQYGLYSLSYTIVGFVTVFTDLGIGAALTRYIAYYSARGDNRRVLLLIKTGVSFTLLESIIVITLTMFFIRDITSILTNRPELIEPARVLLIAVLFQVIVNSATSILLGFTDTGRVAVLGVFTQLSRLVISPSMIILGFGLIGSIVGNTIAYGIGAFTSLLYVYSYLRKLDVNGSLGGDHAWESLISMLNYGIPLYASGVIGALVDIYRNALLARIADDFTIGNFNVAARSLVIVAIAMSPISMVLFPAFSRISGDLGELKRLFRVSIKYSTLLITPITLYLATMSREVVYFLYGRGYTLAPIYLSIMVLSHLLIGIGYVILGVLFTSIGDVRVNLYMALIYAGSFVSISMPLTNILGVYGLLFSILLASGASTIYGLMTALRKYGIGPDYVSSINILMASTASTIPLIAFTTSIPSHGVLINLIKLLIGLVLYAFTYLTLIPVFRAASIDDIEDLSYILSKIRVIEPFIEILLRYEHVVVRITTRKTIQIKQ